MLLFGGNGYTTTGQGEIAERMLWSHPLCLFNFAYTCEVIYRETPGYRIPGGSEDVLLDLAIKQLVKAFQIRDELLDKRKGPSKL